MRDANGILIPLTYAWVAYDYARGEGNRTYAVKFLNEEDMSNWKEKFEISKIYTMRARLCLDCSKETIAGEVEKMFDSLCIVTHDSPRKLSSPSIKTDNYFNNTCEYYICR